ncbi:MAG: DUF1553 domain-containing protein, partial [Verrucomicrobiota bacterium]
SMPRSSSHSSTESARSLLRSDYIPEEDLLAGLPPDLKKRWDALQQSVTALDQQIREREAGVQPVTAYCNTSQNPGTTHILARGNVMTPREKVLPGGVAALRMLEAGFGLKENANDRDRRVKLAEWITAGKNPLFARVAVNRLWHYHFGAGLVKTPNDFGYSGGEASHPELLDWLASEFKARKYSIKAMHRLILHSATYRQSAARNPEAMNIDADNRLLWRMSPRRLEGEELRDTMLAVSGKLNPAIGGRGYRDMREYKFKGSHFYDPIPQDKPDQFRRTLYRFSPRGAKRTMLDTFDCPDPSTMTPARAETTTPLQSLALMNNAFVLLMSDHFADRLKQESGEAVEDRIQRAWRLAYGRAAETEELNELKPFVETHGLPALARVLFNSNEFLYIR